MHEHRILELLDDFQEVVCRKRRQQVPPVETGLSREDLIIRVSDKIRTCELCVLCRGRTRTVPGYGCLDAKVMIIGEGPGAEEDRQGLPFVGTAGQYLDKWLAAISLSRKEHVFIGNVVKCRPPGNRDPLPEEVQACLPYLIQQVEIVRPQAILALGRIASQVLLGSANGIGMLRGTVGSFEGIPVVPTYHPSGVLRNPEYRRPVWDDLKVLKSLLEKEPS